MKKRIIYDTHMYNECQQSQQSKRHAIYYAQNHQQAEYNSASFYDLNDLCAHYWNSITKGYIIGVAILSRSQQRQTCQTDQQPTDIFCQKPMHHNFLKYNFLHLRKSREKFNSPVVVIIYNMKYYILCLIALDNQLNSLKKLLIIIEKQFIFLCIYFKRSSQKGKCLSINLNYDIQLISLYMKITHQDIQKAHQRIKPYIHQTPILSSTSIAKIAHCQYFALKCQNLQKIGAFKPRGAMNSLLQLPKNVKAVCTHSSGNHAQALAYAAKKLGLIAYIVMPQNSPKVKKEGVKSYGGIIIESGNTLKQRQAKCKEVQQKYNAYMVHPYNDYDIITGQATCAKQIFQQMPNFFDYIVFPIGGGGLASGCLLSTKYFGNNCRPIGVEPYLARDAKISLQKNQIEPQLPPITIADGLRTSLGDKTFQIIKSFLKPDEIILVTDEQIIEATRLVMERMKIVIEPSSASVVAAVIKDQRFRNKKVCCVISGGNIDMTNFFEYLKQKAPKL